MKNKIYTFRGQSFELLPNDLSLLNKAAPLLIKYRKLHYEYTKDINMQPVEEIRERAGELKTAITQLESIENKDQTRIDELTEKLHKTEDELKNNNSLQSLIKLYNDCEGLVMYELITDIEFMKPFLKKILAGTAEGNAASGGKPGNFDELDFTDTGIPDFIKEIITDFFLAALKNRQK